MEGWFCLFEVLIYLKVVILIIFWPIWVRIQICTVVIQDHPCGHFEPLCAHVPKFTNISHFVCFRSPSAICGSFCFFGLDSSKMKGWFFNLKFLLKSGYFDHFLVLDLSKDPNMYSSYTGSLLLLWTTVRSCTKDLLTYPISLSIPFGNLWFILCFLGLGSSKMKGWFFLTWSSYLKVGILIIFLTGSE